MSPRKPGRAHVLLLGLGLLSLLSPRASALGVLPLGIPGNRSLLEGDPDFTMTFTVTNNTGNTLLLDYALAIITPLGPDPSDTVTFAGANGSNGLAGAPLYIPKGESRDFTYNLSTPHDPPDGKDFGINRLDFFVEMHTYTGSLTSLPNPNNISSVNNFVQFVDQNTTSFSEDPAALATVKSFNPLPFGTTLFTNTDPNSLPTDGVYVASTISFPGDPNPFFDKSPRIRVGDVPEPSGLVLLGTSALVAIGYMGRGRMRRGGPGPRS